MMRTPRERWGTCCPNDPNCEHSYIEDDRELTRHMDTPISDNEAAILSGRGRDKPYHVGGRAC